MITDMKSSMKQEEKIKKTVVLPRLQIQQGFRHKD